RAGRGAGAGPRARAVGSDPPGLAVRPRSGRSARPARRARRVRPRLRAASDFVTAAPLAGQVTPALECVPNVSEGRDRYRLRRLAETVTAVGARLVDLHYDVDHHRSV